MDDDPLVRRILDEADIAARPGQYDRLIQIADEVRELLQDRDLRAKVKALRYSVLPVMGTGDMWTGEIVEMVRRSDVLALLPEEKS